MNANGTSRYIEIRKWMLEKGIRQIDIARQLGVTHSSVHLVIRGIMKSARIENHLRGLGCPEDILRMERMAA